MKYMPSYVVGKFLDGTVIKTPAVPTSASKCEWMYKQVILLGLTPLVKLKETIPNTQIEVKFYEYSIQTSNFLSLKFMIETDI